MEFTIQQAQDLKNFLSDNEALEHLDEYTSILKTIDSNTMKEVAFDLSGEQTDDIREVYAYMMRNRLTRLDLLKKASKKAKK